ncbi:Crp/Fnr family transcriptional regulator [Kitasatospora sp. NPDC088391]|uniref:Crp/Fnr family transcriptional regulator n=1 Tax=Kitasatospora sp. NPDC088391 TaxID=3364074 RepID=UPI00382E0649
MATASETIPENSHRLPMEIWQELCALGRERRYPAGSLMLHQGDLGLHLLALTEGLVKVVRREENGETTLLAFRGAGDLLGEGTAFDRLHARIADVVALRPCRAVVLEADRFRRFVEQPNRGSHVMRQTIARLRESDLRHAELRTLSLCTRLARTLLRLVRLTTPAVGAAPLVLTGLTQEELAHSIGSSRAAIVVGLHHLREAGAIGTARRAITVLDLAVLNSWAHEAPDGL